MHPPKDEGEGIEPIIITSELYCYYFAAVVLNKIFLGNPVNIAFKLIYQNCVKCLTNEPK
jgi:hypothetical protein